MNIEERVEIVILAKYYDNLLTDKKKNIVKMYVDNNLSLAEISEELKITRQAVKDSLDNAVLTLKNAEEKLKFIARDKKIKQLIEQDNQLSITSKLKIISLLED